MGKRSRRKNRLRRIAELAKREHTMTTLSLVQSDNTKRFQLARDAKITLDYPELYLEVYIAGSPNVERMFADMFTRARCSRAPSPEKADLVVFTGGPDVWPGLYGEDSHALTRSDQERDSKDLNLYTLCEDEGIPMFGVCRGAQFLHVANGGKLLQHVNNHYGDHQIYLLDEKRTLSKVSSTHHQMCIPNDSMKVLADSSAASERWYSATEHTMNENRQDPEAFFYRDTCCLGVQGHPEYAGYEEYAKWCLDKINEYIVENPDITRKGRVLRLNVEAAAAAKLKEAL